MARSKEEAQLARRISEAFKGGVERVWITVKGRPWVIDKEGRGQYKLYRGWALMAPSGKYESMQAVANFIITKYKG